MFFYFFFEDTYEIIKYCFKKYAKNQIESKFFCDVTELFADTSKQMVKNSVEIASTEINSLYGTKYPSSKEDLKVLEKLYKERASYESIDSQEAFAVLFWSFKVFKKEKQFQNDQETIMQDLMQFVNDDLSLKTYRNYGPLIYDISKVSISIVNNINEYFDALRNYSSNGMLFYRGHSKTTYHLTPAVFRSKKLKENEKLIYEELLINCPHEFKGFNRHIDYLVKMQHYGLPTRLLDITRNPLVALYFACCSNQKDIGEVVIFSPNNTYVKYENSDTVAMLSSLPLFSYEEQEQIIDAVCIKKDCNIVERFIREIATEKPGFINKINKSDLLGCFIVLPRKSNNRIIKQDGAFIICGVNIKPETTINQSLRLFKDSKAVLLFVNNKSQIMKELDLMSVNKSSLFPEIDSVSEYIKNKYSQ